MIDAAASLFPVVIILSVGMLSLLLARRFHQSTIVAYLVAGAIVGQNGLGILHDSKATSLLAELGVVFLLFDIGMHFSLRNIWESRRDIFGFAPLQVISCTGVFYLFCHYILQMDIKLAIAMGLALSFSSTAVVMRILKDRSLSNITSRNTLHHRNMAQQIYCPNTKTATSILIFQDVCAIFLLIYTSALDDDSYLLGATLGLAFLKTIAAFMISLVVGRFIVTPFIKSLFKTRHEEILSASTLFLILVAAWITGSTGLSLTLGAFLAGMTLADLPHRHAIMAEIKPFRGLLLGFFFITIGMMIQPNFLIKEWPLVALFISVMTCTKLILTFISARLMRYPVAPAIQISFLLAQGSEFALVLLSMPVVLGMLSPKLTSIILMSIILSLFIAPYLTRLGFWLAYQISASLYNKQFHHALNRALKQKPFDATIYDVLILGFDTIQQRIAETLDMYHISYICAVDHQDDYIEGVAMGYKMHYIKPESTLVQNHSVWDQLHFGAHPFCIRIKSYRHPSSTLGNLPRSLQKEAKFEMIEINPEIDIEQNIVQILHLLKLDEASIKNWQIKNWDAQHDVLLTDS
jgi:Kef-type K+ transport system membrane component KefB